MKIWAFYKDDKQNWVKISIYQVLKNEAKEPGRWLRDQAYWSTHTPAEKRVQMHIRRAHKARHYFVYQIQPQRKVKPRHQHQKSVSRSIGATTR